MKFVLMLYICSMVSNECQQSIISGYQFDSHNECVFAGYGVAQHTFQNLQETEDFEKDYIEQEQLAVKFECKGLNVEDT